MTAHGPSNGTCGSLWRDEWCDRCTRDHAFSHVNNPDPRAEDGCRYLLQMMVESGPFDFLVERQVPGEGWDPRRLECRWFDRCHCQDPPGDDEPIGPPPVHPDQGALFDVLEDSPVTPGGVVLLDDDLRVRVDV